MGKHERLLIEEAEHIIIKLLMGIPITGQEKANKWFYHASQIASKIKEDFTDIKKADHIGNRYDIIGDILINDGSNDFYLEIKMSEKKASKGTLANISQDALTEFNLFYGNVKSWSQFRKINNHDQFVINELQKYKNYPPVDNITNTKCLKEHYAAYLRKKKENGDQKAKKILDRIHYYDEGIKKQYLSYLAQQPQNYNMVKKFFILIKSGIHKSKNIKKLINKDEKELLLNLNNLIVYYSNISDGKIMVRREDMKKALSSILTRFRTFKLVFPQNSTQCKLFGVSDNEEKPLLNIVFHWKNISQGIKTPCLNIFDCDQTTSI